MKKPTKPTRTTRNPRRPRVPVSPCQPVPSPSSTASGILSADIQKKGGAIHAITVRIAPHHVVTFTGGAKPAVSMACTHHGFVAEAFELNGQLEQVINHIRKHFPELRAD